MKSALVGVMAILHSFNAVMMKMMLYFLQEYCSVTENMAVSSAAMGEK